MAESPFSDPHEVTSRSEQAVVRGVVLYAQGDVRGAAALWREAVSLCPDDERAVAYLAWADARLQVEEPEARPAVAAAPAPGHDGDSTWLEDDAALHEFASVHARVVRAPSAIDDGHDASELILDEGEGDEVTGERDPWRQATEPWRGPVSDRQRARSVAAAAGGAKDDRSGAEASVRHFLARTPTRPNLLPLDIPVLSETQVAHLAGIPARSDGATPASRAPARPASRSHAGSGLDEIVDLARRALSRDDLEAALTAAERAVSETGSLSSPALAHHTSCLVDVYERVIGDRARTVRVGLVPHSLDARAAFMLSRVDGTFTIDDLIDVSGMEGPEALRLVALLMRTGALFAD